LLKPVFIGKNLKEKISGRVGEQTLPQQPPLGRENADGGANAPPTTSTWPRFRGPGVARWPHQKGGSPGLVICPFLLLDFLFLLQTLMKQPLIVWLQPLDSGRILLNLLICQDFALISSFRIYSELNQNLVGF